MFSAMTSDTACEIKGDRAAGRRASRVAAASFASGGQLPSRLFAASDELDWRDVLARVYDDPDTAAPFTTLPSPDLLLVLNVRGTFTIESKKGRTWAAARYHPGVVGVTAPFAAATLRWRNEASEPRRSLHLHLSRVLLAETAAAIDRPDVVGRLPDALVLEDAAVVALASALGQALTAQASPLEADSLAQALALQILWRRLEKPAFAGAATLLSNTAFAEVASYMEAHLADDVLLDDLAGVAAISKFHFLRLFRQRAGVTPHQFLTRLRMERAAQLLAETAEPVQEVARRSGYASPSRFASAFKRQHGTNPLAFRQRSQRD
jgi:AraC family transcriptional regulator